MRALKILMFSCFKIPKKKHMTFILKLEGNVEIKIKRPSKPFRIEAGEKSKQVVVLYTEANLAQDAQKDTHIPLNIKAYALNSKEPIEVFRKSVFIYPPSKALH